MLMLNSDRGLLSRMLRRRVPICQRLGFSSSGSDQAFSLLRSRCIRECRNTAFGPKGRDQCDCCPFETVTCQKCQRSQGWTPGAHDPCKCRQGMRQPWVAILVTVVAFGEEWRGKLRGEGERGTRGERSTGSGRDGMESGEVKRTREEQRSWRSAI